MTKKKTDEFEVIARLARGFWAPRALLSAVEIELFAKLGGQSLTPSELAERLDCDARGVELMANALVGLELLTFSDGRYAAAPRARRFLDPSSPEYRGGVVQLANLLWERWSRLSAVVRAGADAIGPEWDERAVEQFTMAMHQRRPTAGQVLVRALDLHDVRRVVDLGGGAGTFSEALALALPEAQIILVDRPQVIAVARRRLPDDLLAGRMVLVEHDFMAEGIPLAGDPPGNYDLALLSSVIHLFGPEDNAALLGRIYDALEPGGQVAIRDFLVDPEGTTPVEAALFAVNMLVNTPAGRCYSFEQIKQWLNDAGFGEVVLRPLENAIGLVTARRA